MSDSMGPIKLSLDVREMDAFRQRSVPDLGCLSNTLAARFAVILHLLAHFSIENALVKGYICGSVDMFVAGAKGEGSPACSPFAGRRRGRSLSDRRSRVSSSYMLREVISV